MAFNSFLILIILIPSVLIFWEEGVRVEEWGLFSLKPQFWIQEILQESEPFHSFQANFK